MADVTVKLKIRGVREVLRSRGVQAEVARRAKRAAAMAGDGFEAVIKPHKYTSRAFVQTKNSDGRKREAEQKVLNRALDAMR